MAKRKDKELRLGKALWWASFLFLWLIFSIAAISYLDPDFGWHLKAGEWIWQHRHLPQTDQFSYTMADYPWVNPEWLTEVVIFKLYPLINYPGLAILFSALAAWGFLLGLESKKMKHALVPLIFGSLASLGFMAARPQMVSFFLAALWFTLLRRSYQNPKNLLALPFLMVLWVNLHAGFFLGFALLVLAIIVDLKNFFQGEKNALKHLRYLLITGLICFLFSLLNPFGIRIYQWANHFTNWQLHTQIAEWLPYTSFDWSLIIYAGTLLGLAYSFRSLSDLDLFTLIVFLAGFLLVRRFLIFFIIFTLPTYVQLIEVFLTKVSHQKNFKKLLFWQPLFLILLMTFVLVSFYYRLNNLSSFQEKNFYPAEAVTFLKEQEIKGNFFSVYNWGGYLIWKLPEKKVFIDGRMPCWKQNGFSAFETSSKIYLGEEDFQPIFEKYSVSLALLPKLRIKEPNWREKIREKLGIKPVQPKLQEKLEQEGWGLIYQDEIAEVWQGTWTN